MGMILQYFTSHVWQRFTRLQTVIYKGLCCITQRGDGIHCLRVQCHCATLHGMLAIDSWIFYVRNSCHSIVFTQDVEVSSLQEPWCRYHIRLNYGLGYCMLLCLRPGWQLVCGFVLTASPFLSRVPACVWSIWQCFDRHLFICPLPNCHLSYVRVAVTQWLLWATNTSDLHVTSISADVVTIWRLPVPVMSWGLYPSDLRQQLFSSIVPSIVRCCGSVHQFDILYSLDGATCLKRSDSLLSVSSSSVSYWLIIDGSKNVTDTYT